MIPLRGTATVSSVPPLRERKAMRHRSANQFPGIAGGGRRAARKRGGAMDYAGDISPHEAWSVLEREKAAMLVDVRTVPE